MDIKGLGQKVTDLIMRYKYVLAVVLIGIVLMTIPIGKTEIQKPSTNNATQQIKDPGEELGQILSKIRGAGRVEVLLSLDSEGKTIYQTDNDASFDGQSQSSRNDTVIITDADRNQQGLIQQVLAPSYRGAVVVCQGADDPAVKLAVMEAVKNATGLGYDKICVLKMK